MILIDATIEYKGYDPRDLKPKSNKRVCKSCDQCGRVGYIEFKSYKKLCLLCVNKLIDRSGDKNPMWGKKRSPETLKKVSDKVKGKNNPMYGVHRTGKDCPNWKGGFDRKRPYILPENQCRKINTRFEGSEFHHLSKSIGVYIPKELHRHLYHNLRIGINMDEMSILAFQYLKGEL